MREWMRSTPWGLVLMALMALMALMLLRASSMLHRIGSIWRA